MYDPNSCPPTPVTESHLADISNQNLSNDEMKEMLQCPVCLDITLPPIHTCRKGHIVCNSCQESSVICPLCESNYSYTRSYVAEGVFDKCTLSCKFCDDGCTKEFPGGKLVKHHRKCQFKPVRCNLCDGNWIEYSRYLKHLENTHKLQSVDSPSGYCSIKIGNLFERNVAKFICPPHVFHGFGKTFLFFGIGNEDFLCTYVSLFGSKRDEMVNYDITIKILPFGELGKQMEFCWKGLPVPLRLDPFKHVFEHGGGLIIPLVSIKENSIKELNFHVSITETI